MLKDYHYKCDTCDKVIELTNSHMLLPEDVPDEIRCRVLDCVGIATKIEGN